MKKLYRGAVVWLGLLMAFLILSAPYAFAAGKGKSVTNDVVQAVVQKMLKDGALTQSCVKEAGGESKIIKVTSINLNAKGSPQFEVTAGETPTSCTMGARSAMIWLYDNQGNGYRFLLDAGATDQFKTTKEMTHGYYDIETAVYLQGGAVLDITHFKFNGKVYRKTSSREMKNKDMK